MKVGILRNAMLVAISMSFPIGLTAQQNPDAGLEELVVTVKKRSAYAYSSIDANMVDQQTAMTSVLAVIDNLPGVLINEGDVFGSDDWSTTISIRGFTTSLNAQQIGITVDGLPNGNSNYGGGAKANRYIDTQNLGGVTVSQGTADIASRSNEALGGTLNFLTQDPEQEARFRISGTVGDFDAKKYYGRYDTGTFMNDTRAWISVSSSDNKTWIDESGESNREHIAAKIISQLDTMKLTGYASWDDSHEDNYQSVTLTEFQQNPDWDRLTGDWTGVPHVDQLYRRAWSTLRENLFTYGRAEFPLGPVDMNFAVYYHSNEGRGDWNPPYVVDVTNDGAGIAHSELDSSNGTVLGGPFLGRLTFVDPAGIALLPAPGCASSLTFPYGGAGPQYDADCFAANANPVSSYRHTHYYKRRYGMTSDFEWEHQFDGFTNTLRGGVWYEDYYREEYRDWHKIIDSTAGYNYDKTAYWRQYDREYPLDILVYYMEDMIEVGFVTGRFGIRQYNVDIEKRDNFQAGATTGSLNSDSDLLFSGGLIARTPVEGLEVFAGYAENFAAIKDEVLESDDSTLSQIEPETATNIDLGLRYEGERFTASLTYYDIDFDNRITFVPPGTPAGIDYLIGTNGSYVNVGGVESKGFELGGSFRITDNISTYVSYTNNSSDYLGTGDSDLDTTLGIFPGNTVYGSAEDMFVVSADWNNERYNAGISTKWVGDRWLDAANTQRIDSYMVADLYLGVSGAGLTDWLKGIEFQFVVNNISDERYIGGADGGTYGYLGGARTAALTLTADF